MAELADIQNEVPVEIFIGVFPGVQDVIHIDVFGRIEIAVGVEVFADVQNAVGRI